MTGNVGEMILVSKDFIALACDEMLNMFKQIQMRIAVIRIIVKHGKIAKRLFEFLRKNEKIDWNYPCISLAAHELYPIEKLVIVP